MPATPISDDSVGYNTLSMISHGLNRRPLVTVRIPVNFFVDRAVLASFTGQAPVGRGRPPRPHRT